MKRMICCLLAAAVCIGLLSGCSRRECEHSWVDADCEKPKTCLKCDETMGDPLPHEWKEATCTEPKSCLHCDAVEGEPVGHTPGPEQIKDNNFVQAIYQRAVCCTVCDAIITSVVEEYTTFIDDGVFIFTPEEFGNRLSKTFKDVEGCNYTTGVIEGYGAYSIRVYAGDVSIDFPPEVTRMYFFNKSDTTVTSGAETEIEGIGCLCDDMDTLDYCLQALIMACDPCVNADEARTVADKVLAASINNSNYIHNGVRYAIISNSGQYALFAHSF